MDIRDGRIYTVKQVAAMNGEDQQYLRQMEHHPTPIQRVRNRVGRNDPCPCGSSKKFKKCCLFRKSAKVT